MIGQAAVLRCRQKRSLPDDIPHAIQRLRHALQAYAAPLLGVLERVAVANVPLMWEVASLVEVDR